MCVHQIHLRSTADENDPSISKPAFLAKRYKCLEGHTTSSIILRGCGALHRHDQPFHSDRLLVSRPNKRKSGFMLFDTQLDYQTRGKAAVSILFVIRVRLAIVLADFGIDLT